LRGFFVYYWHMISSQLNLKNATTDTPFFLEGEFPLPWSMTRAERYCMISLLERIQPKVSIEVGCYNGGSLQVISKYSEKVYVVDIDPELPARIGDRFENVEFVIGDSQKMLPELIHRLNQEKAEVGFVLIDGDHSTQMVRSDIESTLVLMPLNDVFILLHDSFNPPCREGMRQVDYAAQPHVHYVELDFIPGIFNTPEIKGEMWGGLGMILLKPTSRSSSFQINESHEQLYEKAYLHSRHYLRKKFGWIKSIRFWQ